jgi:pyridoxal phosphate enzyme (YggS family)
MGVLDNYKKIQENIADAAAKARRSPKEITLVAVTKNASPEQMKTLIENGVHDLGESRVQQLQQRSAQMDEWLHRMAARSEKKLPAAGSLRWHMIGHLQRNKVKPVVSICSLIHSIDSLRLAEEIHDEAVKLKRPVQVLLEVNVSEESCKHGVAVGAAVHLAEQIDTMEELQLIGLMTMAPYSQDPEDARPHFARLREIYEEVRFRKIAGEKFKHLSMGMSGDYAVAVEEGATMVRVGTALFG